MNKIAAFIKRKPQSRRTDSGGVCRPQWAGASLYPGTGAGKKKRFRMDKVNAALAMFDMEAVPGRKK